MDVNGELDKVALVLLVYRRLGGAAGPGAHTAGGDLVMFDYAYPEPARSLALLTRHGDAAVLRDAQDLVAACSVDLYRVVREHYVDAGG